MDSVLNQVGKMTDGRPFVVFGVFPAAARQRAGIEEASFVVVGVVFELRLQVTATTSSLAILFSLLGTLPYSTVNITLLRPPES